MSDTSEEMAKRLLKDVLGIDGPDHVERRIAVVATYLETYAAGELANYERRNEASLGPVRVPGDWQMNVLRRIEHLERDTKSMDDAFSTRFKRLENRTEAPTSFLTTPRAAVEELRAVHNPHGGPGWYWWDIEDHRDGSSGPFQTWAVAAADAQSVGYQIDNSAYRSAAAVNKRRGQNRRYWSGDIGGATYTVIAKDVVTAIKRIAQHMTDAGESDEYTDIEISVGEMTEESVNACVIRGDNGGPLVDMPYGMVACSEY